MLLWSLIQNNKKKNEIEIFWNMVHHGHAHGVFMQQEVGSRRTVGAAYFRNMTGAIFYAVLYLLFKFFLVSS